jgi:phosphatidylglycerol:prolipoprotein diacylglycerol transferase
MLPLLDPVAFTIGAIKINWYGIILGFAALMGLLMIIREGKRYGISPDFFMDLVLIGVPAAIISARIYYVAFQWGDYKDNFSEVFKIWHGGIAIHGALIGAILGGVIYTRIKKVDFWRIADIAAPGLILGQLIGRWGNFVNQEAHGGIVERSFLSDTLHIPNWIVNNMEIVVDGVSNFYHPTFLYESVWNLLVLVALLLLRRRPFLRAGELFITYFIFYSIGRFFIEGLRTDSLAFNGPEWLASLMNGLWAPMKIVFDPGALPEGAGNIPVAQFISIVIIIGGIILLVVRRRQGYAEERYADPILFGEGGHSGSGDAGNTGFTPPPTIVEQEESHRAPVSGMTNAPLDERSDLNGNANGNAQQEPSIPNPQERIRPGKPFI